MKKTVHVSAEISNENIKTLTNQGFTLVFDIGRPLSPRGSDRCSCHVCVQFGLTKHPAVDTRVPHVQKSALRVS
jgi:hypothetical protein